MAVFREYSTYLSERFQGQKVQKISVNAGSNCPNRDGEVGRGGCTYCNNHAFSPSYTMTEESIASQIEAGKSFFGRKYPNMKYLVYFQSYTSTHGSLEELKRLCDIATAGTDVVGLVIGTRPDCVDNDKMDYLAELNRYLPIFIEFGVESTHNDSLVCINRGHTFEESIRAIEKCDMRGLPCGAHLIIGLPGENVDDFYNHIKRLSALPITSLKLHQLQILKGTAMAREYEQYPDRFSLFTVEEYLELVCQLIRLARPTIYFDRFTSQSPDKLLIAPRWGIKNYHFTEMIRQRMEARGWYQGELFQE